MQPLGLSASEALKAAREFITKNANGIKKELDIQKDVHKRLQELMGLEVMVMNAPARIDSLATKRDTLVEEIRNMESKDAPKTDQQFEESLKVNAKKAELNNTLAGLVNAHNEVRQLDLRYEETSEYINKKLGIKRLGFFGSLMSKGGRMVKRVVNHAAYEADARRIYG